MYRYLSQFLLALCTLTSLSVSASAVNPDSAIIAPDTVAVITNPSRVTITDSGALTTIEVEGTESNPDYHFKYSVDADTAANTPISFSLPFIGNRLSHSSSSQLTLFSNCHFGLIFPYHSPQPVRASWEYGLDVIGKQYNYRGASFGIAVGLGGKNYSIRRGTVAEVEADRLVLSSAPEGAVDSHTDLSLGYLSIPVYYNQKIYRTLAFRISAEMHYNFLVRGKSVYTIDNIEYSRKLNGLHQRPVTPEFTFTLGSTDFGGLYFRWAPVSVFKSCYGPRISTYSIGITLSF